MIWALHQLIVLIGLNLEYVPYFKYGTYSRFHNMAKELFIWKEEHTGRAILWMSWFRYK